MSVGLMGAEGLSPRENEFFRSAIRGRQAKDLYTQLERLTFSCRVTLVLSEMVNLHSRQIKIPTREIKEMQQSWAQ